MDLTRPGSIAHSSLKVILTKCSVKSEINLKKNDKSATTAKAFDTLLLIQRLSILQ